jgi:hypothetical protein
MPLLRLLLAGLMALFAMAAVLFTALVVLFTGLLGWVGSLFRPKGVRPAPRPVQTTTPGAGRRGAMNTGDVIDIEATKVPDEPPAR